MKTQTSQETLVGVGQEVVVSRDSRRGAVEWIWHICWRNWLGLARTDTEMSCRILV